LVATVSKFRAARLLAVMTTFVMFASSATCFAAAAARAPKDACHTSGQPDAGRSSLDPSCCQGEAANTQPLTPVPFVVGVPPAFGVLIAVLPVGRQIALGKATQIVHTPAGSAKPPGLATYVFVSSFRL
jgi:hypothetical protein